MFWIGLAAGAVCVLAGVALYEACLSPPAAKRWPRRREQSPSQTAWQQTRQFLYYDGTPPAAEGKQDKHKGGWQ